MMSRWGIVLAVLLLSLFASPLKAQSPNSGKKAVPKTDEKLLGDWIRVSEKVGDFEPVSVGTGPCHLIITPSRFHWKRKGWDSLPSIYAVDPRKSPKIIDVVETVKFIDSITGETVGPAHQHILRGIYKVEGNLLTICWDIHDHGRPKRFSGVAFWKWYYLLSVYRRDKR
jgi:uncharacterized protein (TIGR03067 family)